MKRMIWFFLFGGGGRSGIGVIEPPTLTWDGEATDSTPDFLITFVIDGIQVGDTLTIDRDTNNTFPSPTSVTTSALTSTDVNNMNISYTSASLSDGTYYYRAKINRGSLSSAYSSTETVTLSGTGGAGGAPIGLLLALTH